MPGNSVHDLARWIDTKHHRKLTPHIFRYGYLRGTGDGLIPAGIHTINEGNVHLF